MQRRREHRDGGVGRDGVPAADDGVLERVAAEAGRSRPQTQALVKDLPHVGEPMHLLEGRAGGVPQDLVHLRARPLQEGRVLQQVVEGEGEQARGGLVTGDQEGDALCANVGVGQPFAGLAVDAGEHPAEQVGGVPGFALGPPVGDEPVDQVVHERLVLLHLPLRPDLQPGLDRQLSRPGLGLGQGAHHGLYERMRRVAVEGVEPVAEPAQRDGVEGQTGHVVGDLHLLARVESVPLVHELVRDINHPRHVVAHRLQAERRHQDVVGAVPERVVGLGCEQARVRRSLPQVGQPPTDPLVEARVVTDLLDQFRAGDDQAGAAGHAELEDRPVLLGHRHEPLDGVVRVDVERVPHDGQTGGAGNVVEVDRHAHGRSSGRGSVSESARVGGAGAGTTERCGRPATKRSTTLSSSTQPGNTSRVAGWKVVLRSRNVAAR